MATRKSGDGSRSADATSDRPGSYVKVSGSRRRRKGRRGNSLPPGAVDAGTAPRVVDTVAEVAEDEDGRISDLGGSAVDDLRRPSRPSSSSNRSPRREHGPLGLEDIRTDPPRGAGDETLQARVPREVLEASRQADSEEPEADADVGSDPPGRRTLVEIDATSRAPRTHPRPLFDDDDYEEGASEPLNDNAETDRELAERYALGTLSSEQPSDSRRPSSRPSPHPLASSRESLEDVRQSLSSVLGARPSLRPSPPPQRGSDAASLLWWTVVCVLTAIIAAALVTAVRERVEDEPEQAVVPADRQAAPEATGAPAEAVTRPPVSFGTPQTAQFPAADVVAPAAPSGTEPARSTAVPKVGSPVRPPSTAPTATETPASPRAVAPAPAHNSAAVRPGAAGTSAVTGAAAAGAKPPTGPAVSSASTPRAPSKSSGRAAGGRTGEASKTLNAAPAEPPPAEPAPAPGLPINPYEEE